MLEKIAALLNEKLDIDTADVTLEASFKEDLEIDSLDLFDLVMSIEEEFGLEIPSEELEKLTTVGAFFGTGAGTEIAARIFLQLTTWEEIRLCQNDTAPWMICSGGSTKD